MANSSKGQQNIWMVPRLNIQKIAAKKLIIPRVLKEDWCLRIFLLRRLQTPNPPRQCIRKKKQYLIRCCGSSKDNKYLNTQWGRLAIKLIPSRRPRPRYCCQLAKKLLCRLAGKFSSGKRLSQPTKKVLVLKLVKKRIISKSKIRMGKIFFLKKRRIFIRG